MITISAGHMDVGRRLMKVTRRKFGFTLIELMMVIVVISLVATLATGAAMRSVRQSRKKKVEVTRYALQSALTNYRARENRWPWASLPEAETDSNPHLRYFTGRNNAEVFRDLIQKTVQEGTPYLDLSALQTDKIASKLKSRTIRDYVSENGVSGSIPIGYLDPDNQSKFRYYRVIYNITTDSVSVEEE